MSSGDGCMTAEREYGPLDAVCVLMAARQQVAWRDGSYYVNGKRVTLPQVNRLAERHTGQPFALAKLPAFAGDSADVTPPAPKLTLVRGEIEDAGSPGEAA
jgi:hypothetical protein